MGHRNYFVNGAIFRFMVLIHNMPSLLTIYRGGCPVKPPPLIRLESVSYSLWSSRPSRALMKECLVGKLGSSEIEGSDESKDPVADCCIDLLFR